MAATVSHPAGRAKLVVMATIEYARDLTRRDRGLAVEGPVDLAGPDDPLEGFDAGRVPGLLRDVFSAAGGTHDDWDEYDRVMAAEHRTAVLVAPERITTNPALG